MQFTWDDRKEKENVKKHTIKFTEAVEIFNDPLHISLLDTRFNYYEERWITIGAIKKGGIITVGHLYIMQHDGEDIIRIITARKATKKEIRDYEEIRR
ncbi:MAG: BrnT family toxin [Deltaproteobacteria bacterium]|nr:BrnT family toxin [Deltaproteobacteria bacterium]MBI5893239.1 BrnT family toxin [Deltaproteobacteria bacterium]